MLDRVRRGVTFSNVMSMVAVFIALSAGAYAALGKNTVGSKQIKKGGVNGVDIADGTTITLASTSFLPTTPNSGAQMIPVGHTPENYLGTHGMNAPVTMTLDDFFAAGSPMAIGQARRFEILSGPTGGPVSSVEIGCTVMSGRSTCRSSKRALIKKGQSFLISVDNGPGGASSGLGRVSYTLKAK